MRAASKTGSREVMFYVLQPTSRADHGILFVHSMVDHGVSRAKCHESGISMHTRVCRKASSGGVSVSRNVWGFVRILKKDEISDMT